MDVGLQKGENGKELMNPADWSRYIRVQYSSGTIDCHRVANRADLPEIRFRARAMTTNYES